MKLGDLIGYMRMKDNNKKDKTHYMPLGMCIGIAIGTAIGAATDNLGMWMPIGLCLGVSMGIAMDSGKSSDDDEKMMTKNNKRFKNGSK